MPTANELISAAYSIALNYSGEERSLSATESTFGLNRLNAMLDSWKNDRLMVFQLVEETITLTANDDEYTIGSGGDKDTTRPIKIVDPCFIRENNIDYPVTVLDKKSYGKIVAKTSVTSNYPEYLYYESAFPLGTIYLYPVPSSANVLHITTWQVLQFFDTLTESMSLPPGYQEAIEYNLAQRIAGAKGFSFSPENKEVAREAKALIKSVNSPPIISRTDLAWFQGRRGAQIEAGE